MTEQSARRVGPLFVFALALPLLGYLGFIGLAEAKRWGAPTIEVAIEGYDPRDPVRGQYLRYRLRVEDRRGVTGSLDRACAGAPKHGVSPVYLHDGRLPTPDCKQKLPAAFVQESHRYYVQQDKAGDLEKALFDNRATVTLRLISDTQITVDELLIDGR